MNRAGRPVAVLAVAAGVVAMGAWRLSPATPVDENATGWTMSSLNLDVVAHPDSQVLRTSGTLTAVAPSGGSSGPDLLVASGGVRFDSVESGDARVLFSAARDSAGPSLRLRAGARRTP